MFLVDSRNVGRYSHMQIKSIFQEPTMQTKKCILFYTLLCGIPTLWYSSRKRQCFSTIHVIFQIFNTYEVTYYLG